MFQLSIKIFTGQIDEPRNGSGKKTIFRPQISCKTIS